MLDDVSIQRIEKQFPEGLTSGQILEMCASYGISLSEANLRKYVQLGLLPRSIRIGRKGKHQGSLGVYPVRVLRRIQWLRHLMAENFTIQEIQQRFALVHGDVEQVEEDLSRLFRDVDRSHTSVSMGSRNLGQKIMEAKKGARELIGRLRSIEAQLVQTPRAVDATYS